MALYSVDSRSVQTIDLSLFPPGSGLPSYDPNDQNRIAKGRAANFLLDILFARYSRGICCFIGHRFFLDRNYDHRAFCPCPSIFAVVFPSSFPLFVQRAFNKRERVPLAHRTRREQAWRGAAAGILFVNSACGKR